MRQKTNYVDKIYGVGLQMWELGLKNPFGGALIRREQLLIPPS